MHRIRPVRVQPAHKVDGFGQASDATNVLEKSVSSDLRPVRAIPWALEMRAVSVEDPGRLMQTLSGGILGCGGWILSRGASDTGTIHLLFEFERQACLDIYSVLVGAGVELSQVSHIRLAELCQCTRLRSGACRAEIASVDLEILTFQAAREDGVSLSGLI